MSAIGESRLMDDKLQARRQARSSWSSSTGSTTSSTTATRAPTMLAKTDAFLRTAIGHGAS